ncbi:MAG TPA: hypothetical protein P5136_00920 [Methanofastidiosum sp.]|nr:hypothetical protein [Methanofastidiosum sp.]
MKKVFGILLIIVTSAFLMGSRGGGCQQMNDVSETDVKIKTSKEGFTAEQLNIKRRVELASDSSKIWWIYCLSDTGTVVFYGAVKGKVTSSKKSLPYVTSDGTSGESDEYVYWFSPAGTYFQWNGKYFLTSAEVRVETPVINHREVRR